MMKKVLKSGEKQVVMEHIFLFKIITKYNRFNDTVVSGVVYYYKVRAFRNPTNSGFSNEVNTDNGSVALYPAPSNLSATIVNSKEVKLSWTNDATNELQIIVERKLQSETSFKEVKRLAPGTTTWTDNSGLTTNLTVYYRLKSKYSQAESDYTNEFDGIYTLRYR